MEFYRQEVGKQSIWSKLDQDLGFYSSSSVQLHYSTAVSTMSSLRAAAEFCSDLYIQHLALD